jgi:hypothetical protein
MSQKKAQKITREILQVGRVYWSKYFKQYIIYEDWDFDNDFVFKFTEKSGYCVVNLHNIEEAPELIQILLGEEVTHDT